MKKFWNSKKFWLIFALIGIGLFIWFFWLSTKIRWGVPEEIKNSAGTQARINKSVSSVYRYDFQKQEYLSDEGQSWQNSDFARFIYDLAPAGSTLEKCYYFLYDNFKKEMTGGNQRKCNSNLTITVGENKNCSSQGENACTLYVYAVDDLGIQGEMATVTYNIDYEGPRIGKVSLEDKSYLAEVSDNLKVSYCWLYLNNKNVGSMKIENNLASLEYSFLNGESYNAFVRCADQYDAERGEYLNINSGELTEIVIAQNHPPKISFCRVIPTQGSTQTNFKFETEASDPDGNALSYQWDFGDGEISNEKNPSHYYKSLNTYEPKVIVSDGEKELTCLTAWIIVSE